MSAVPAAVSPSETTMPTPSPASISRFASFAFTKLTFGGRRPHTASIDDRRLPIQPSPVSSTPASPTMPTPERLAIAVCSAELSVLPNSPGTFAVRWLNRSCWVAGCECSTKPVIDTASSSNGNSARKLKYVIAPA